MKFTAFVAIFALAVATGADAAASPKKPAPVTTVLCSSIMNQPGLATCETAVKDKKCVVGKDCDLKTCCAKLKPVAVACNTRTDFTCTFGFKKEGNKPKTCFPGKNCNSSVCCLEPTATVTVTTTATSVSVSVTEKTVYVTTTQVVPPVTTTAMVSATATVSVTATETVTSTPTV